VIEQHRSGYIVAEGPGEGFAAESPPEWQRASSYRKGGIAPEDRAAVGDWVLLDGKKIVALLPRHSAIKRGAAGEHYKQQLIAANIDTVFVVCGLDADFNPRRIERYLVLVSGSGVAPVVVLTKADKAIAVDPNAVDDARAELVALGQDVPVVAVNAKDRDSVAGAHAWLQEGKSAVLVGSSGAGKSTLTNTLLGIEKMKTNEVRESDSRGRHTTTHRALIPLPTGACLIDTPGMRELKPTGEKTSRKTSATSKRWPSSAVPRLPACEGTRLRRARRDRSRHARRESLRQLPEAARRSRRRRRTNSPRAWRRKPTTACRARRCTSGSTRSTGNTDDGRTRGRHPPSRRARRAHGPVARGIKLLNMVSWAASEQQRFLDGWARGDVLAAQPRISEVRLHRSAARTGAVVAKPPIPTIRSAITSAIPRAAGASRASCWKRSARPR
jgi:ribosome small subunit-dependent GTPase A